MDDNLEPTTSLSISAQTGTETGQNNHAGFNGDEEEEDMPDWTRFVSMTGIAAAASPAVSTFSFGSGTPDASRRSKAKTSGPAVIPKRGEKDFEPKTKPSNPSEDGIDFRSRAGPASGSGLQNYALERARKAMLGALSGTRGTSRCVTLSNLGVGSMLTKHFLLARTLAMAYGTRNFQEWR